jgi:hypothetical protein
MMANSNVSCCSGDCGLLVPLVPNGGGKTTIRFDLDSSTTCGIPVSNVLRGKLEGLIGRDDLAELNPNTDSVRFKIEVRNISTTMSFYGLTHADSCLATNAT